MVKTSVYVATSLDGFIARPDGELDWLESIEQVEGEDFGFAEFIESIDVLVMGRTTYEAVRGFDVPWPYDKPVVVLASSPVEIPDELADSVRWSNADPATLLEELRRLAMSHVYVDGGKTIQSFLRAGLIDQLIITRVPILIGQGIPLFGALDSDIDLEHIATSSYTNGLTQSTYEVVDRPPRTSDSVG